MIQCDSCKQLVSQYQQARHEARQAKRQLESAVTAIQEECAKTWLRRIEGHWLYVVNELVTVPRTCECQLPELPDILADYCSLQGALQAPNSQSAYIQ